MTRKIHSAQANSHPQRPRGGQLGQEELKFEKNEIVFVHASLLCRVLRTFRDALSKRYYLYTENANHH